MRRATARGAVRSGRTTVLLAVGALLLAAPVGCSDTDKPPWVPLDGGHRVDGMVPFLGDCKQDADCASGRCADFGGKKRCSQKCSSAAPCPTLAGWSCSAQSFCVCQGTGKQPTVCGVDGDCDGVVDKKPTAEICNGEDDNCNGVVDDVAPGTTGAKKVYRDADGDGHGDQNKWQWMCKPEPGWVESADDCDDTRSDVYPGAAEVCGDNVDHNCNNVKDDPEICGLTPIVVADVNDPAAQSAVLKSCGVTASVDKSVDITEIVAKQDKDKIKYTVRLAGSPATAVCSSYTLHLGTLGKVYEVVFVYRPAVGACGGLPETGAYQKGQPVSTKAVMAFNAADPGHVSFTIPKSEYFPSLTTPSYYLKACSNAKADALKDLTDCSADSCETPVHR